MDNNNGNDHSTVDPIFPGFDPELFLWSTGRPPKMVWFKGKSAGKQDLL